MKFVGDDVEKKRAVENITSDHQGEDNFAGCETSCESASSSFTLFSPDIIRPHQVSHFLPTESDLSAINSKCWSVEFCASTSSA